MKTLAMILAAVFGGLLGALIALVLCVMTGGLMAGHEPGVYLGLAFAMWLVPLAAILGGGLAVALTLRILRRTDP